MPQVPYHGGGPVRPKARDVDGLGEAQAAAGGLHPHHLRRKFRPATAQQQGCADRWRSGHVDLRPGGTEVADPDLMRLLTRQDHVRAKEQFGPACTGEMRAAVRRKMRRIAIAGGNKRGRGHADFAIPQGCSMPFLFAPLWSFLASRWGRLKAPALLLHPDQNTSQRSASSHLEPVEQAFELRPTHLFTR